MNTKVNLTALIVMSFLIVSCEPSQEELKAIEDAKQVEVAKCVRYNSDIVYEEAYERYKKVYGDMDAAMTRLNRSLGSYKTSNMMADAQPNASKKRKKYMPYLKEMCEESLLFIYNVQEIPERFYEELGLEKAESKEK
jgi:hypothetical protein